MLTILIFICAYMIKGGWLARIPAWLILKKKIPYNLGDGTIVSSILVFLSIFILYDLSYAIYAVIAWLLAVTPSMGEEAGAIGRYKYAWGDYIDKGFTRSYGIKKGLQRGAWMGAMFTLFFGSPYIFIPFLTLGFIGSHFIGQELYYRIHKTDSWAYAECLLGFIFGLSFFLGA